MNYYFKIFKDGKYIEDFAIDKNNVSFGRSKTADFTIQSSRSSRQHFVIVKINNNYCLKDLGSSNGTFLNKQQLPPNQEIELKSGDVVSTDDHKFIFEIKDDKFDAKVKSLAISNSANELEDIEQLRINALAIDDSFDRSQLNNLNSEVPLTSVIQKKNDRTKKIRISLILIILAVGAASFMPKKNNNSAELASKNKEKQRLKDLELQAVDHFNLALRFYNQNDFERCIKRIRCL